MMGIICLLTLIMLDGLDCTFVLQNQNRLFPYSPQECVAVFDHTIATPNSDTVAVFVMCHSCS